MITLDKNHEIWPRESPTDKLGLSEIRAQFNSPRKKFWRFLQTVKTEKISPLNYPHPTWDGRGRQISNLNCSTWTNEIT